MCEIYMQHMVMHWREDVISYENLSGLQSWKGISTFLKHPCTSPLKTGDLILDSQDCIQPWCNKAKENWWKNPTGFVLQVLSKTQVWG
jgi:hypothetical protein